MKRELELGVLSALGALPLLPMQAQGQTAERPNVIYILADDMGIGDLGCYGQEKIKTPALDRLAENGIRFTQHYAGAPVSAPSRCTLLTGKHTGHAYIRGNKAVSIYNETTGENERYDWPLAASETTVATLFRQAGYATGCAGKWGLGGPDTEGDPKNQGFDYFYGYLGQGTAHSYYPEYLHEIQHGETRQQFLNGQVYSHDTIMNKALEFIDSKAGQPFFLYLAPTLPHAELVVPEDDGVFLDYRRQFGTDDNVPYDGTGSSYSSQQYPLAAYAAMVTRLDSDIQRVVDRLDKHGILENTIIMFASDNGVHKEGGNRPDYFDSNGAYRGYKRDLYEGGIRTPFIVSWPARIAEGRTTDHLSAFWDFLPTMCDLLDVETPPGVDGISYLPTLTGEGRQQQHDCLYWEFHEQGGKRAVRKGDWKLIQLQVNNYASGGTYRLHNIAQSPGEADGTNVASTNTEKLNELLPLLESCRTANENWDFASVPDIEGQDILEVSSSQATSEQNGEKVHKSHDQDFSTLYHSAYSNKISPDNPDTITYTFAPAADIAAIIYCTRTDDSQNGNFKEFELWVQKNGMAGYEKVGDYNFGGVPGQHRMDFAGESGQPLPNIRNVRFIVKSGTTGFASCAEMLFYGKRKAYEIIELPGLERITVTSALASSEHNGREIKYAYDGKFDKNYHSRYGNDPATGKPYNQAPDYFPVVLDFFFEPADVETIMYYTRTSELNGNFKAFEVWGLPAGQDAEDGNYVKIGEYDFQGLSGIYQIDFTGEQQALARNLYGIRFRVLSGHNNFASCSEIVFYTPAGQVTTATPGVASHADPHFVVQGRHITCTGCPRAAFDVYTLTGLKCDHRAPMAPGVYVARCGNHTEKVLVR